jgi:hypothetical protein
MPKSPPAIASAFPVVGLVRLSSLRKTGIVVMARGRRAFWKKQQQLLSKSVVTTGKTAMSGLYEAWLENQRELPGGDQPLRLRLWKAGEAVPATDFTEQEPGGKEISIVQFRSMLADLEPGGEIVLDDFRITVDEMGMVQLSSTTDSSPLNNVRWPLGKSASGVRPRGSSFGSALLRAYRQSDARHQL